jgi:hypothetical protein
VLLILTGDIQIGKTRWLVRLIDELGRYGVPVAGVVAPGVWRERADDEVAAAVSAGYERRRLAGSGRYEKLGIDNVLLPQRERVTFARRHDIAAAEGLIDPESQSERAQLGWVMPDEAIERVDRHFEKLIAHADDAAPKAGLLVVDELGRLELMRGGGLVHALDLLGRGPTARWPHALTVVRADLYPLAEKRLADAWGGRLEAIGPDDASRERVLGLFGIDPTTR